MDSFPLLFLLPAMTFVAVLAWILWSKSRTDAELEGDKPHSKSSLALDGPGPQLYKAARGARTPQDGAWQVGPDHAPTPEEARAARANDLRPDDLRPAA